jgi:DNA-binding transcriptional LysR family regulator
MRTFDASLLETLVAFGETRSLIKAAMLVDRTPSAVTAQMQRLEAQVGVALLAPEGRGRRLTPAGQALLVQARRVLAAHQDAWLAVRGEAVQGALTLGMTEDFAQGAMASTLRRFADTHPRVRVDVVIDRSAALTAQFDAGRLDLCLALRSGTTVEDWAAFEAPMIWLSSLAAPIPWEGPVPIAVMTAPCGFRDAALGALEKAGRAYRIASVAQNPSGLMVATAAGLAVTPRSERWLSGHLFPVTEVASLPALPNFRYSLRMRAGIGAVGETMAQLLTTALEGSDRRL